jgi:hypothetical protein
MELTYEFNDRDVTIDVDNYDVSRFLRSVLKKDYAEEINNDPFFLDNYIEDNWDDLVDQYEDDIKDAFRGMVYEARDYYDEVNRRY